MKAITGYERAPLGKMLDQIVDLKGFVGLVHERSIGFEKEEHTHHRHLMVCPRGSCRMDVRDASGKVHKVDSTKLLWVPKEVPHSDHSRSSIYDVMALFPSDEGFASLIADNGLDRGDAGFLAENCVLIRRTRWLDDILDRYFFERVLNRRSPPGCTFFLEKQIMNEFARIVFDQKLRTAWRPKDEREASPTAFDAAIRYIETNLFEPLAVEEVAAAVGVSPATLLRAFKTQLAQTPYEYLKKRRLDEAMHLLKKREHAVGDIALLVGYDDFSAFSRAFKKEFGKSPQAVLRSEP